MGRPFQSQYSEALGIKAPTLRDVITSRTLSRKRYIGPFLVLAGVALFISSMTAGYSFWLVYTFLIVAGGAMFAPYGPFFSIVPEMLPKNVAGGIIFRLWTAKQASNP